MWASIKGLFSSRKFWLTVIGTAVCSALKYAGVSEEFITVIAGLFGVSIVARAVGDLGPK
jgi:nicotinamide riboside transporter PnuC